MRAGTAMGIAGLALLASLLPRAVEAPGPAAALVVPDPPDLRSWGLTFVEAKPTVAANGRPAAQLTYAAEDRVPGPVTIFVTDAPGPDTEPSFRRQNGVNLVYWRRGGHGYYIAGHGDDLWMRTLRTDVGRQLKAL
jgi:anti-sigma factor RsiW